MQIIPVASGKGGVGKSLISANLAIALGQADKKVILADLLAELADEMFLMTNVDDGLTVMSAWIGAIAYTLQIYFDFSGYSDMAIGLGRCFGFHYRENFNYPYIASSVTDFWRRWHISLTSWFRDYVYIPLGGNRCSKTRHIFNLFVCFLKNNKIRMKFSCVFLVF